jgi:hypothetical protein
MERTNPAYPSLNTDDDLNWASSTIAGKRCIDRERASAEPLEFQALCFPADRTGARLRPIAVVGSNIDPALAALPVEPRELLAGTTAILHINIELDYGTRGMDQAELIDLLFI